MTDADHTDSVREMNAPLDVSETLLQKKYSGILETLLKDRTTGGNIIWATENYQSKGPGYAFNDQIIPDSITGDNGKVIMPRVMKAKELQTARSRDKAEVFTPAWVCNKQNNLIDDAWFGVPGVFNTEIDNGADSDNGVRWKSTPQILFPEGKRWQDYIALNRMEITCGEAPYLVSRYDVTKGLEPIPVNDRIGLLDRKFRVINQMTRDIEPGMTKKEKRNIHKEWRHRAYQALQSTYGFEWQGDNLLLAREAVFMTFIDYYKAKWHTTKNPDVGCLKKVAEIISWNLWQMDGIKLGIPGQTPVKPPKEDATETQGDLFDNPEPEPVEIPPEKRLCKIKEWTGYEPLKGTEILFADIVNTQNTEDQK